MIDIVRLIRECEVVAGSRVSVEFNYNDDDMLRISFKWHDSHSGCCLSRTYHNTTLKIVKDVTGVIIDDFIRHTAGDAK